MMKQDHGMIFFSIWVICNNKLTYKLLIWTEIYYVNNLKLDSKS